MPKHARRLLRGAATLIVGALAGGVLALFILDHKSRTAKVRIGRMILRRREPFPGAARMPGSRE